MHRHARACTGMHRLHRHALACTGMHRHARGGLRQAPACTGMHWHALACICLLRQALACTDMHRHAPCLNKDRLGEAAADTEVGRKRAGCRSKAAMNIQVKLLCSKPNRVPAQCLRSAVTRNGRNPRFNPRRRIAPAKSAVGFAWPGDGGTRKGGTGQARVWLITTVLRSGPGLAAARTKPRPDPGRMALRA